MQHSRPVRHSRLTERPAPLRGAALCLAAALLLPACRAPIRPDAPPPDRDPLVILGGSEAAPPPTIADLTAARPLGSDPWRADFLAGTDAWSAFLVQSRRGVKPSYLRAHRERLWVLSGSGTCIVDGKSYPAVAGSAFVVDAGKVRRIASDADTPFVALVVIEPAVESLETDRVDVSE